MEIGKTDGRVGTGTDLGSGTSFPLKPGVFGSLLYKLDPSETPRENEVRTYLTPSQDQRRPLFRHLR